MKPVYRVFVEVEEEFDEGSGFETISSEEVFRTENEDEAREFAINLERLAAENQ